MALWAVGPSVAHCDGPWYIRAGSDHRVPLDASLGPVELSVGACHGKTAQFCAAACFQPQTYMSKTDSELIALNLGGLVQRPRILDRVPVDGSPSPQREPLANFQLPVRMNVLGIAHVDGDCQPGPWNLLERQELRLAQLGPRRFTRLVRRCAVIGELHDQKLQVLLL